MANRIRVMHADWIDKMGGPVDLDHHSENRFDAEFIGRTAKNLPATVFRQQVYRPPGFALLDSVQALPLGPKDFK